MGKKKDEAKKEKPVFGSGAEPQPEPKDDGLVRCVCTVACAWCGYHDEGDKVFVKRELLESDPFFKGHFKALEPLPEGQRRQDGDEGAGGGENADAGSDNADGDELFKNSVKGPQGDPKGAPGENADGGDERGEEATSTDESQGKLDLK